MKKGLLLIASLLVGMSVWGQSLTENFNYTGGTALTSNGWTAHSGGGTNVISVTSTGTGLSYSGSSNSAIGFAASLTTSGEDINRGFTAISSGSIYVGLMVNVTAAQATGDYFFHIAPATIGSDFKGRIYAKSTTGGYFIGFSKAGTNVTYSSTVLTYNTVHYIVLKYTFVSGATNDQAALFIDPTLGGSEPSATLTGTSSETDISATGAGTVALRQGNTSNAPTVLVDGILVGTSWASVTPLSTPIVNLSVTSNSGSEATPASITLTATSSSAVSGDQTVDVAVTGTGITAGDYTLGATSITILSGATTGTTTFTVVDDGDIEGSETATVTISSPTSGLVLGSTLSQNIVITDNDTPPSASISISGSVGESNEDAGTVTVTLANDTFVGSLTPTNWTITNLPAGVTVESITRDSDTQATIAFSGNRITDYDSDITNLTVSVSHEELTTLASGSVSDNSGFTFTATNDAESITIADDGSITEGAENGEIITVTLVGGTFISTINAANFTVSNLPTGVTKGTVTRTSATSVTIVLSGNATIDYDANITNVTVSVNEAEVDEYTGANLTANTGVTLTATVEPVFLTFEFVSLAGDETTVSSSGNDANLTASTMSRGAGLTATTNAQRLNATNWALTSIANAVSENKYMEFTITPQTGFQFSVSSIFINLQRSATGPSAVALRSSVDGYASDLDQVFSIVDNTSTQSFTFTFTQNNSSVPVTYRFYMYAEATGGSGGIGDGTGDDIIVTGSTSVAPANTAPTASSVSFSGTLNVGQLLTGSYTYSDSESDVQGTSTFRWMRSDDGSGTNKAAIGGATSLTYTLVSGDNGKHISFEVTPVATTGVTTGTAVESSLQGPIANPTTVQFSTATSSVAESGGTIDLTVSIANPSGSVATTVDVALTSGTGSAADINTYTTQTVTFPAGSSTSETVTLTVTDDAVMEGNETLGFTLQNVTGGSSATLGAQTTHTLTITDDDNASITLSGSATESSEDASVITVNLTNDTFEPSLTTGNWAVTNLPAGVTKGALNRVSDTQATITLSGNRTTDYDTNFSPIVTIDHAELVVTSSGSASANSGFTFTANDDAESITVAGDGSITEGSESGEILTVTLAGGTISSTFSQSAWTLNNLPAGLSKGTVTQVNATQVTIAITGTATDYDENANVTVSVSQDQIDDYSGSDLTSTNNVVFTAIIEAVSASTVTWNFATASPSSTPVSNLTVSAVSQGNNNGTTTLLTTTSPSTGYAGASGTNNAGAAARTGGITTGASGSAYFEFSLTPDAGYNVTLSSFSFGSRSTGTGPAAYSLRSSLDGYATTLASGILLTTGTWELKSNSGFSSKSPNGSAITYRIYGHSGAGSPSANTANWRIDDLTLGLTVTVVASNPTSGSHVDAQISGNTTLTGNLTVSGTLTISGANLSTGSNSINLGTTGSISGETTTNYILGTVNANPTLSGGSPVGIAGLGLTINPNGNNLGSTVVIRRTGPSVAALGVGINRRWTITPTSQPSGAVDVTITWPSADDNGRNPSNLFVWKSDDNGVTWQMHAGPFSTGTNPRSITFTTTSFSDWTVSDGDSPLPIKLLSWTATPGNKKVTLNWETASELNHDGFEIYRSTTTKENFRLFKSYISSNELKPKGNTGGKYSIVDQSVLNMETYHYKLVDVSVDGKRKEHKILTVIPTDGKPVQPGFVVPITFKISSIYPNPFNPTTNLVFDLPNDGLVVIRLYNVIGQEVQVIRNEIMKKGREKVVNITTNGLPSGVYMVSVEFGGQRLTKSLTFLK
ncbi:MAG: T9SS type A sorting domain-containing protein [Bacteroidetes bacterium]|nr:T9SS type A sorting domain-containing protein [Bacteroidota bacterium]